MKIESKIETVTIFRTSDGKEFENNNLATRWNEILNYIDNEVPEQIMKISDKYDADIGSTDDDVRVFKNKVNSTSYKNTIWECLPLNRDEA